MWTVGVDTGGTFTDVVAVSEEGELRQRKVPSTPADFSEGVVNGIRALGLTGSELRLLYHGTTVSTNAAITKTGAHTALVTTAGFRDLLEIRRGNRGDLYDLLWDPPQPLVARRHRLVVDERTGYDGEVLIPLDELAARKVARTLRKRGIEAVAVCFLNSYVNPANERQMKEILLTELPEAAISVSSEILPEPPEFERTATTVANAYLVPVMSSYLRNLQLGLTRDLDYQRELLVVHSGGGLMTAEAAAAIPARTVNSGPAAGVMAAVAIGQACGRDNVISLDMGGTSCDIAVIHEGRARVSTQCEVEWGLPIQFPSVDLVAIGAGGGSIAWIDQAGYPRSGPQSAGADPGPACYGKGGTEPTNTDANLVLGRLDPTSFLGGELEIEATLAHEAVRAGIAEPLGLDVTTAADGILRISNANMAKAIRLMTIQRGFDPREFSLLAFGGAGPLHAVELARELQIPEVIVPSSPGLTSALGLLFVDLVHNFSQSLIGPLPQLDLELFEQTFRSLEEQALTRMAQEGFQADEVELARQVDLRYLGQVRALTVPLETGPISPAALDAAANRFHELHRREFRYAMEDVPVESYILRVSATGTFAKPSLQAATGEPTSGDGLIGERQVFFSGYGFLPTRILDRLKLQQGAEIEGPAIIEQFDSTTVLPPGSSGRVDEVGNLVITPFQAAARSTQEPSAAQEVMPRP